MPSAPPQNAAAASRSSVLQSMMNPASLLLCMMCLVRFASVAKVANCGRHCNICLAGVGI
jgi:hypothetical protein